MEKSNLYFDVGEKNTCILPSSSSTDLSLTSFIFKSCWLYDLDAVMNKTKAVHKALVELEHTGRLLSEKLIMTHEKCAIEVEQCRYSSEDIISKYSPDNDHLSSREWLRNAKRGLCAENATLIPALRSSITTPTDELLAIKYFDDPTLADSTTINYVNALSALFDALVIPEISPHGEITQILKKMSITMTNLMPGPFSEISEWMYKNWINNLQYYAMETEAAGGIGIDLISVALDYINKMHKAFNDKSDDWKLQLMVDTNYFLQEQEIALILSKTLNNFTILCKKSKIDIVSEKQLYLCALNETSSKKPLSTTLSTNLSNSCVKNINKTVKTITKIYANMSPLSLTIFNLHNEKNSNELVETLSQSSLEVLYKTSMVFHNMIAVNKMLRRLLKGAIIKILQD